MTQYTYTHIADEKGKMVEKMPEHIKKPVMSTSLTDDVGNRQQHEDWKIYKQYENNRQTIIALGFSPSDNGKTFNEGEFEVKTIIDKEFSDNHSTLTDKSRIIAVPLSENTSAGLELMKVIGHMKRNSTPHLPDEQRMNDEQVKEITSIAWKGAANAFRMYPNNKHTFTEYWDAAKEQFQKFINK